MDTEAENVTEELELTEDQIAFEDEEQQAEQQDDDGEETVISFGDEGGDEEQETPLVKRLRDQIRDRDRKLAKLQRAPSNDDDPEPQIPARPSLEAMDYDQDRFDTALEARDTAIQAHAEWKVRQAERENAKRRNADEQAKQVEQQRRALGVGDYEERVSIVRDRLTEPQMAILINATDNPAKLLYALGRSETKLDELAGIDNLAKFAARVGQMESAVKVTKKKAPPPETQVRGATASTAVTAEDKHLAALEREAARTGDRSKIAAYRREKRQQAQQAA